jgi:hypothetical protein
MIKIFRSIVWYLVDEAEDEILRRDKETPFANSWLRESYHLRALKRVNALVRKELGTEPFVVSKKDIGGGRILFSPEIK